MADDDDSDLMRASDFDTHTEKTLGEQRSSNAGHRNWSSASSTTDGSSHSAPVDKGFGAKLWRGSSKLFGAAAGSVAEGIASRVSGDASGQVASGIASSGEPITNGSAPVPPTAGSSTGAVAVGAVASGVSTVASGSVTAVTAVAGGVVGGVSAVGGGFSALGKWATKGPGRTSSSDEMALNLLNAMLEFFACAAPACNVEDSQRELKAHVEALASCQSTKDIGIRLLDFWYIVRCDALTPWSLLHQQSWVRLAYNVKYGSLRKAPGVTVRAICGLLLELAAGMRPTALTWTAEQYDKWVLALRYIAHCAEEEPPPTGYIFPGLVLAREMQMQGEDDDTMVPVFFMASSDAKSLSPAKASDILAALKAGSGRIRRSRPPSMLGVATAASEPRALTGSLEAMAAAIQGDPLKGAELRQQSEDKGDRMFIQKTRPVNIHNQACVPLKVCIFAEDDRLCAVPLGGIGGPCVATLEPNLRAQMRPPGNIDCFQVKVIKPGLIETKLYYSLVQRGQSIQLRSNDCTIDS